MSKRMNILVVDDDPGMARTLAAILGIKGYQAHVTHSGAEALQVIDRTNIDLVLTDIRMPHMNGVDLYRAIKRIRPHLPTLFMTAYANDDLVRQGLAEGIETVLTKPLDMDSLLALLAAYDSSLAVTCRPDRGSQQ